ncbi:MAG: hypothetical protein IJT51_03190 [Bacteroidales bacterium]|nr:hypothetical protein [Bacteroidales bacterium]
MAEIGNGKFHLKKPSATFFVCLLLSVVIWLLTNFSKDYTIKLDYDVVCTDMPENLDKVTLSDSVFAVVFHARGFDFLKSDYSANNRIIELPVKQLVKQKRKNLYNYTFTKQELTEYLKNSGFHEDEFVEVETPERFTIYLR